MPNTRPLSADQIDRFINDGFVKLEGAFPRALADEARAILWRDLSCDPNDRTTWTQPVVRLGLYGQEPFAKAGTAPALQGAFDQLVGEGRWLPRVNLGTFPVRFPSPDDPGDTGWHIDVSFARDRDDPNDFLSWRANIVSEGRALLLLFLFSDIDEQEAPTRIRVGSHIDIARMLAPAGHDGLTLRELAANSFDETAGRPEVLATGEAGTVYLCHPFLVHAAQPHHGREPRFIAQPPLMPKEPVKLARTDGAYSPLEISIRQALA